MRHRKKDIAIIILSLVLLFETVLVIFLLRQKIAKPKVVKKAKLAIVIDDWGYNQKNLDFLRQIDCRVNISILPFLPFSTKIATEAKINNLEVVLHLPLEPHERRGVRSEKNVILTTMNKEKVSQIFIAAVKSVPYARGISNHMGSKATEDEGLMKIIFGEMKKRRLYFLDSLVTPKSVCEKLSGETGVRFVQRNIFLDNETDASYIRGQLASLLEVALKDGQAIGIGHDRVLTLKTVKEFADEINKEKFEFVFVSELTK